MADDPTPEAKPSPVRKILLFLVFALVAVGAGGAAAYTQRDQIAPLLGEEGAEAAADPEEAIEFGAFAEMEGVVINPRETAGQRYLMVKVGVEAAEEATLDRLNTLSPVARDAVLTILAEQTVSELSDVTRRDSIKADILDAFNRILGEDGPVTRVYFTQFVLQ
ncbi:MAG: flagellar basal body-associated FliL family protein [Bacteroidota bacterium]